MQNQDFLAPLADIAREAGQAILEIYNTDFTVTEKDDHSPLTAADLASHQAIIAGLTELTPDIPVLSEESVDVPYEQRRRWGTYWLVDPLDGTKEFIKRNGEFTVNIALIENGIPIAGVVHVPVTGVTYLGASAITGASVQTGLSSGGAVKIGPDGAEEISVQKPLAKPTRLVASRSHRGEAVDAFIARAESALGPCEVVSMGSSLKLCLVAEGRADVYPRLGPTSEWDTAAAHAVVLAAGGRVVNAETGEDLAYNSRESLLNPFFIVYGDSDIDWMSYL